jgi:hypothetical protein
MEKSAIQQNTNQVSFGDSAVSGLFGGLLGGIAMGAVIGAASLAAGQGFSYLGKFAAGTPVPPLQGFLMHLAVSSIYGILYALLYHAIGVKRLGQIPGWLTGLLYAMLLWTLAVTILLPTANALILSLPWWVFFAGHVAYGLVLGLPHHKG